MNTDIADLHHKDMCVSLVNGDGDIGIALDIDNYIFLAHEEAIALRDWLNKAFPAQSGAK